MIFPDPKKSATVILSKGEKMQDVKPETEMDPSMEGLKSAAEDILQAVSSKSPHDLMTGLKSFFEMVDQDEDEPESEDGFHI